MRRGAWHQCGSRTQKVVLEHLQGGVGVGAIISTRDLGRASAAEYAQEYRTLGADVLVDHQFYVPDFTNKLLATYPLNQFRASISSLHRISAAELANLSHELQNDIQDFDATAVLAPAVVYEAGRPEIIELNSRLFQAAKDVGNSLGKPTYATVVVGQSVTSSAQTVNQVLSAATALDADGWYYGFEFPWERVPSSRELIARCCAGGLLLACTNKPVLHSYAGPTCLLSHAFGATGAAIGHSKTLWLFNRGRFGPAPPGGGPPGPPPPRYFSRSLWGTIVYPDEVVQLPQAIRQQVLTHSPHSGVTGGAQSAAWPSWEASKHAVHIMCGTVADLSAHPTARQSAAAAATILAGAQALHTSINQAGVTLADSTACYQGNWAAALTDVLNNQAHDFDFLELIP